MAKKKAKTRAEIEEAIRKFQAQVDARRQRSSEDEEDDGWVKDLPEYPGLPRESGKTTAMGVNKKRKKGKG